MNRLRLRRRDILKAGLALGIGPAWAQSRQTIMRRPIPSTGEELPVVGLGTWAVFNVAGQPSEIAMRRTMVDLMIEHGATVIDTSPEYQPAEEVIGEVIAPGDRRSRLFIATKVWSDGRRAGERQMERSLQLMRTETIDLMQVHNLRDVDTHMSTIREWQDAGRIRYNGITHYRAGALDAMEAAIERHDPQFIQINYSLGEREAERRLLPMAQDLGLGVLINRPFAYGRLFRSVRDRPLPRWALEYAASWGQFFLKFIISHPAVTCVIPGTSQLHHMEDNLAAGFGPLPDEAMRARMARHFDAL